MKNRIRSTAFNFRQKAEELLKMGNSFSSSQSVANINESSNTLAQEDIKRLIYELEVHRIELELQNEELGLTVREAEKSAQKYSKLFDFAPSGYFILSGDGEIIDINLYGASLLGKSRSLLKNNRFGFFVTNETRSAFNLFLGNIFETHEKGFCELTLVSDDDSPKYLYLTGTVDENKELCLITAVDITANKHAEESANKSEEKYRTIFENIQDIFFQTNVAGIVLEISPSIKIFSEYDREEIIGNPILNLYYNPFERVSFLEAIMKSGELHDYELKVKTKMGEKKFISINARLIYNSEGLPDHIDGSMRDITRRKQAEAELSKLQKAIENSKASVVITDLSGNIEYANPYFSQLTGYTREEYTGQNPRFLKSGFHSQEFYKELWDTIKSGKTWEGEFYNRKKNGNFYWENAVISPLQNDQNEITHFVAIKTDITAAKKISEELITAKLHAEESDKLKTAFLNNISHEIRTPFNAILGFLTILQEEDLSRLEREEYTRIVNESSNRLMKTISDIAEVSAIQTGQTLVLESKVDINQIFNDLQRNFQPEIENKGLTFTINIELPATLPPFYTDSLKLISILNNLLNNAVKFTNSGSVELNVSMRDENRVNDYINNSAVQPSVLEFVVKDTGIGIPDDQQQVLFERFMQIDNSNTRKYEGSGLGTTIAKAYAELLGGSIWVISEVGKGSAFHVTIPYRTEPNKKQRTNDSLSLKPNDHANSLKIMIAEDDEASAIFLKLLLKQYCREILIVSNGEEAVDTCRNCPDIDLVFMDIRMPVLDGYLATQQIRQFNPELIIFAQTANALSGDEEKALESGCNAYLAKPIQQGQLMSLLNKYFKLSNEIN